MLFELIKLRTLQNKLFQQNYIKYMFGMPKRKYRKIKKVVSYFNGICFYSI